MEEASLADLERASNQGTILAIRVGRKVYGHGGYNSSWGYGLNGAFTSTFAALSLLLMLSCFLGKKPLIERLVERIKHYRRRVVEANDLKEVLTEMSADITVQTERFCEDTGESLAGSKLEDLMGVFQWEDEDDEEKDELQKTLQEKEAKLDIKVAEVENLRMALDMEQMMHTLERKRLQEEKEELQARLEAYGTSRRSFTREASDCSLSLTDTDRDVMEVWESSPADGEDSRPEVWKPSCTTSADCNGIPRTESSP